MKLYRYYEDCGRMGDIEGLFFLTDEQKAKYVKYSQSLYWDELLGNHSEGHFDFSDETLTEIELPEDVNKILYDELGAVISGPFDFDYFDEMIEERNAEDEEDD